jgi:D-alanine-D-alanine ligase-like ATP-grasp enzyme
MGRDKRILPERLTVGGILEREGRKLGIKVVVDPTWRIAGQITTKKGAKRYFRSMSLDLNTQGAAAISSDKDYASYFLKKMGYPVVVGQSFHSDAWREEIGSDRDWRKALPYAKKLGFPVIVKPNSKSQGKGVTLVFNAAELRAALLSIFTYDRIALVQKPVLGHDYRIVVLDGTVISAYERSPLTVTGDGKSSIRSLLALKQKEFAHAGRDTKIKPDDPRIAQKLARKGLSLASVPAKDTKVTLLDNANLSAGGDAQDVTDTMHPAWKKLAVRIASDMNLRFTGVDLMVAGDIAKPPKKYWVLEVNDSPGIDNYAAIGPAQRKVVEKLYRAVLKAMAR